jgi:hypothetical protein
MSMLVYVLCEHCQCYVWSNECSQIICEVPDDDYFICFDCQPNIA